VLVTNYERIPVSDGLLVPGERKDFQFTLERKEDDVRWLEYKHGKKKLKSYLQHGKVTSDNTKSKAFWKGGLNSRSHLSDAEVVAQSIRGLGKSHPFNYYRRKPTRSKGNNKVIKMKNNPSNKLFFKFTEKNEHEGEKWHFYFPVEGNKEAVEALKSVINNDADYADTYYWSEETIPENEVDILVKHSESGYMSYHQKIDGILDIAGLDDEDLVDCLYKGGIRNYV